MRGDLRQEKEVAIKKVRQTTRGKNAHQVKWHDDDVATNKRMNVGPKGYLYDLKKTRERTKHNQ